MARFWNRLCSLERVICTCNRIECGAFLGGVFRCVCVRIETSRVYLRDLSHV